MPIKEAALIALLVIVGLGLSELSDQSARDLEVQYQQSLIDAKVSNDRLAERVSAQRAIGSTPQP